MTTQIVPTLKSVQLSTGVTLPYVVQGDPDGFPVLLLHGASDSWHSYELLLPHLPASMRAYALTHRGHGDADRPTDGYGPGDFAADVVAFMDALDIPSALLVGHSLSTTIAPRVAIDHPERVRGLALIAAFRNWHTKPDLIAFWQEGIMPLTDPVDPAFVREFQESTLTLPVPPAFLETVISESLKLPARVWRDMFTALANADLETGLNEIQAPTLILWGDQDVYCPRADQEYLAETIPNATLTIYEGVGHSLQWEDPQRVAADLVAFIERLNG